MDDTAATRSQAVVYVDAGYLLGAAATSVAGTALRTAVRVELPKLVAGVIEAAEADADSPVLRLYWYDGARGGTATDEQKQVGLLPRTKIRIGRLSYAGEQKGVDLRLGLDLITNAQRRVATLAYLVSGDDDLAEAVEEAQAWGTQVVLLGVPAPHRFGVAATAENLALTADRILALPSRLITDTVQRMVTVAPTPVPAPVVSPAPAAEATPTPVAAPAPGPPKPGVLPRRPPTPAPVVPIAPVKAPVYSTATGIGGSFGAGPEQPEPDQDAIEAVAHQLVTAWTQTANPEQLAALTESRPQIPAEVDRILLTDACAALGIVDLSSGTRYALRAAFWHAYDHQTG